MHRRGINSNKNNLMSLSVVVSLLFFIASMSFAEDKPINFRKDIDYDIYYQVSQDRVDSVKNVRIFGIVSIGGQSFLLITASRSMGKEKEGYILFSLIKAILPSKYIKPETTSASKGLDFKKE